jgi:undecaprenyl diphosphate synthase
LKDITPPDPFHVSIIMDGNGRWAKRRLLPRLLGHRAGIRALDRTARAAAEFGITHLSVYAFSTENWSRPETEVKGLMSLFRSSIRRKVDEIDRENVRLRFVGRREGLPEDIIGLMDWAEDKTAGNTGLCLIACLNYGGRAEIVDCVNSLIAEGRTAPVTEDDIAGALYASDIPMPDLIIRTSGEQRLSNFWLWQCAYSELYFTDVLWPDFGPGDLQKAVDHFLGRERRYGAV